MNPSARSKSFCKLPQIKEEIYFLNQKNIPVSFVAVAETWLKDFITDAQLHIDNYNLYRSDRVKSKNGGTLLYAHDSIVIDSFSSYDDDTCNGVICLSSKSGCIISCVYRPPNACQTSFSLLLKFLDTFITTHNKLNKLSILLF